MEKERMRRGCHFAVAIAASELEGLADHHLHVQALVGVSRVDADHQPLGQHPEAQADIPFHVRVERLDAPLRCHPADFHEGHELQPLDLGGR